MPRRTCQTLIAPIAAVVAGAWLTTAVGAQAPRQATSRTLRARIVADESGQPLPNARVVVEGTATTVRADFEGRVVVAAAPTATLRVRKAGYVPQEIAVSRWRDEIRLIRAVAIAGQITNDRGEPVPSATVTATPRDSVSAGSGKALNATTDDRGEYRIGGLAPGTYIVSARSDRSTIVGISNGVSSGVVGFADARFASYFPDAPDVAAATPIRLGPGDERRDIDFHVAGPTRNDEGSTRIAVMATRSLRDDKGVTGSAAVGGSVVSSDGRSLAEAVVSIFQQGPVLVARTTRTDAAGAYRFSDLPSGHYQLSAALDGFSMPSDTPPLPYFILDGGGPEITLSDGEDRHPVDVTMLKWGAISGRVLDDAGEPVMGARVGLMTTRYQAGRRRLVVAKPEQRLTNDRGEFRIYGVPVGRYVLAASVGDGPSVDLPGYAPTYFPGTDTAATAQFISVGAGEEVGGVDVPLVAAPTASIRGRVVDVAGRPWRQTFVLIPRSPISARIGARIEADGTFEFRNVAPGRYVIHADRGPQGSEAEGEFLAYEVTVGARDVANLQLQTSLGSRIAGHVTYESSINGAAPSPGLINLSPIPVDFDVAPGKIATTSPNKEYSFELRGISGARRLQATKLPPGWALTRILSNGRNVTDEVLQFGRANQSLEDVEVVLTDQINQVVGAVTDSSGRAVGAARVIVFPVDDARRYPGSRFMKAATAAPDGGFELSGLPTGSYFVAAARDVPPGDEGWTDPAFLDSLRSTATVVTLGEGQKQAVNLHVRPR